MFDELYQSVRMRFGQGAASQSMGDWICANTTIKKRPFSFEDYAFQKAIADDMHPDLSCKKCSQIGLTEVQLRKFLAVLARSTAIAGIFSLPNEKMFTKIYNGRLKPILEQDDVFNPPAAIKPIRNKDQVQIRDSFGYITACTEGDATSISADFLFHDELDLSPQEIIALYQSRLQGSDMQMTQAFSTPTFVNFGIDKKYKMTDQREYFMRCSACNHWQIPLFKPQFVHIDNFPFEVEDFADLTVEQIAILDMQNCHVRCEKCSARLDLGNSDLRDWVATFPTRQNFRGYQVRPFSTSRLRPAYVFSQLAKYKQDGFIRRFYNTVLGEEYTAADAQLQRADIEACMQRPGGGPGIPNVSEATPCYMGIDIGFTCHITISFDDEDGMPVFCLFEAVPMSQLETRIHELMKIYTIVSGTVDRFPYTPDADSLRDLTSGIIMPVQYRGNSPLAPVVEPDTKVLSHYSANRTLILDRLHSWVSHRKVVLAGYGGQKETLIAHLSDMVRNEQPDAEAEWIKTTGNDHYFHSMALNLLARRVCEHMFATQMSTVATSSLVLGAPGYMNGTHNLGMSTPKSMGRLARLG